MSIQAMNDVLPILECLENNASVKEAQQNLQELLKTIPRAIDEIILLQRKAEMKKYSHKMKLCSSQMAKVLPPLCRIISSGTDPAFKEICHYLIAKLRWCLSEIVRISNGGGLDNDSEPSGLFIQSIDKFVTYLNDEKKENQDVNLYIDDLLCHALTIAKMSENEDYNEITTACRAVLVSIEGVTTLEDIEKVPLKKDMILCSLVNLERKVNIAVLRLFLYVTSKFLPPLKSVIKKSGAFSSQSQSKQPGDIDNELKSLDLYFERVQLIGNYAVACSDCKKQKLKVECSLASLEFLADYIIPAAESFYMDPANLIKRRFLQFLTDECIDELKTLTTLLDNIIDTPAFFQVLQEDLSHSIPNLKIKFSKGLYDPQESYEIITKCYKVVSHLKTTDDPIVKENPAVLKKTKEFLDAVRSHADLVRGKHKCDNISVRKFNENLDSIIQSVEDLDEYLSFMCMGGPQKTKYSLMQSGCTGAVSSTPYTAYKENGFGNSIYQASTPSPPNEECLSLDPFLTKIFETPVLRPTLYNRTPYKSLKQGTPRNFSFDISEVLESLEINYTPDEEVASSTSFPDGDVVNEDLQASILYESEMSSISIGPTEFNSVNTLRRNLDINFLENKIKQLTTNEL